MNAQAADNKIRFHRQYQQIKGMVEAQMGLNKQAYSLQWLENGSLRFDDEGVWDYPLAAAQEIGEFLNSWGYAWWSTKTWPITKPLEPQNCMTELVDAWHFLLSQAMIEESGDMDRASNALLEGFALCHDTGVTTGHRTVVNYAKSLMAELADWDNALLPAMGIYADFFRVLTSAGFSLDHFTARYNAKLQLNIFRQLNGYKEKPRTYMKLWTPGSNPKEDNDYLSDFIDGAFNAYQSGENSAMPTDHEVMRWIAVNYAHYTGQKSVTPAQVEDKETE